MITPRFERLVSADSYTNRAGKGTQRAVDRRAQVCARHRHVVRLDLRRHFPNVGHAILTRLPFRHVPEPGLRDILRLIIASDAGIHDADADDEPFVGNDLFAALRLRGWPIGNLTSQFWSNCYLDPLEGFVTRQLGCHAYVRHVDDFALFDDDARRLAAWRTEIERLLGRLLRLHVHQGSAQVQPCAAGVPSLGFVVYPTHRRVKARQVVAATRRLRQSNALWRAGALTFAEFDARVQGWINHVRYADSWGLRQDMLAALPLQRAGGRFFGH